MFPPTTVEVPGRRPQYRLSGTEGTIDMWPMFYCAIAALFCGIPVAALAITHSPLPDRRQILGPAWRTVLFLWVAAPVLAGAGIGIGISQIPTAPADDRFMLVTGLGFGVILIFATICVLELFGFETHLRRRWAHRHHRNSESDRSS